MTETSSDGLPSGVVTFLLTDIESHTTNKVPLLGDIPYLGALFRSKSVNRDKVNLMVFLHPTILRDNETADRHSTAKYNYIRAMQLEKDNEGVPLMSGKGAPLMPSTDELLQLPPPFVTPPGASSAEKATGVDADEQ